jgi:hypothetical protein
MISALKSALPLPKPARWRKCKERYSVLFLGGALATSTLVMPDFMSGIHDFEFMVLYKVVDARDKRGHDALDAHILLHKTLPLGIPPSAQRQQAFSFLHICPLWIAGMDQKNLPAREVFLYREGENRLRVECHPQKIPCPA